MTTHPESHMTDRTDRRQFIKTAGTAAATATVAPVFLNASDKAGSKAARVGTGEHTYECVHGWGEVPDHIEWGDTHGVAVDAEGLVYVTHRRNSGDPMDAVAVFDPEGKFVRSFGKEHHGGGHGIDIRKDGREEFLYLSCIRKGYFCKTTLEGEEVWRRTKPLESGKYDNPRAPFAPTNICFAPDGGFYVGDGYGSHYMHQYDKDANWIRTWGGFGDKPGQMKTPHGQWLDTRSDGEPTIAVCDRANARLQYFTLEGEHIGFVDDLSFPADIDIQGDVLLCPDLHARVSLFDRDNKLITHLGYDATWTKSVLAGRFRMRSQPENWEAGRFIHPHDACFDKDGNIYVVEWVATGRVSFLRKVG